MWQNSKVFLTAFIVLIILASVLSGCTVSPDAYSGNPKVDPFSTDRVATVRIIMPEADWQALIANAYTKEYYKADFWFDDELVSDVAIRTKGNASLMQTVAWQSERFPLAIDFNLFNRARTFHGMKKVHFNNGWSDPTLIRDVISYEIFAEMGVPSPRASIVDLYLNDHHLGVYTMAEAVDASFLARYFSDTTGNLYKPEVAAARLDWREKNAYKDFAMFEMMPPAQEPSEDTSEDNTILQQNIGGGRLMDILRALEDDDTAAEYRSENETTQGIPMASMIMARNMIQSVGLKTNQIDPDYTGLFKLLDVLNNESDATFSQEIEKVLDVDETLRFLAVSAGIVHLDNYIGIGHNTYMYEVNGKFTIIPWDLNMTFGTFNAGIRKDGIINYYIDEPTAGPMYRFPLVDRLLSCKPYLEKYHEYLQQLLDGPMSLDVILPRIDALKEIIRPYAKADQEMFYSYEDWDRCYTEDLRPPDVFEGWEAGGPMPTLPWMISPGDTLGLRRNFGVGSLWELMMRFNPTDTPKLRKSVSKKTADAFLQVLYGPLMAPQPPRQSGFGPNSLGLKTTIIARWESVQAQLNGERRAGTGFGSGNGGSLWLADMFTVK
jgi:spore coat protein CotH